MTVNRPAGRPTPTKNAPPTSRRSARQQRLASREANRNLSRASTRGSSGGSTGPLLLGTLAAVVIGGIIIVAALNLTSKPTGSSLPAPVAPTVTTPPDIAFSGRTLGNPDAKATIDLWSDFQCPICRDFFSTEESQVDTQLVKTGLAKFVWHDEIIIDDNLGGTESLDAANAARCAADQGKFWTYHDWLYTNQYTEHSGAFTKDRLKTIGAAAGLDMTTFGPCVDNGTHNADVKAEFAAAPLGASGSKGTPTVLVNGTVLSDFSFATIAIGVNAANGITPSPSVTPSAAPTATAAPTASIAPATPTAKPS